MASSELTASYVRSLLDYNPESGEFRRKGNHPRWGGVVPQAKTKHGYVRIYLSGRRVFAHKLAWLIVHGWMPSGMDHINMDKGDNRIANLRPANQSQNRANTKVQANNKVGMKGVQRRGDKFIAVIQHNKKKKTLGSFDDPESAHAAYADAARVVFGEFARVS